MALGRAFGEHSVGNADVPERPDPWEGVRGELTR